MYVCVYVAYASACMTFIFGVFDIHVSAIFIQDLGSWVFGLGPRMLHPGPWAGPGPGHVFYGPLYRGAGGLTGSICILL